MEEWNEIIINHQIIYLNLTRYDRIKQTDVTSGMTVIKNFSFYGIYEHYSAGGPGTHPGAKTGFIHRTMYLPHQDSHEVERIIETHSRFVILIQQNEYAVSLFQRDIQPLLHAVNKPYVIITCMDDPTFPEKVVWTFFDSRSMFPVGYCPLFRHWFAINCSDRPSSVVSSKVSPIPYGIDYWTLSRRSSWANTPTASACAQDRHLSRLRETMIPFSKRPIGVTSDGTPDLRIYVNFQFNLCGNGCFERLLAYYTIPRELMSIERRRVNRYETWGTYTQHIFVASPRGNGLDTIRTWEALMLGCIVIVRNNPKAPVIEELYADLPVVMIDRWSDITRDFLQRILSEFSKRTFRYEKLTMKYWIDQIEAAFEP